MIDHIAYTPVLVITLSAIATFASRGLGTLLSGRIQPDSAVIEWITCVTYALVAGLVVRMILLPQGALMDAPEWARLTATGVGALVFFLSRRNVALGVLAGSATLTFLIWT